MATAVESYTQVNAAGSGDKVRDIALDLVQPDGTVATVKMQVIAVADEFGRILRSDDDRWTALLAGITSINEKLDTLIELLD